MGPIVYIPSDRLPDSFKGVLMDSVYRKLEVTAGCDMDSWSAPVSALGISFENYGDRVAPEDRYLHRFPRKNLERVRENSHEV